MSKPQINPANKFDRIVALIDMDCFYCQVEEKLNPMLRGRPLAVVQYNAWRGGGIIAVNYAARAKGVTRHMRGDEAKEQCPDIELAKVPNVREKADLSKYRDAGKEVAAVLQTFTPLLQRASIDEAYLDITDRVHARLVEMNEGRFALQPEVLKNTFALGYTNIGDYVHDISQRITNKDECDDDIGSIPEEDRKAFKKSDMKLLIGSSIVSEIRAAVKEQTGYECSAGIAHNKILAKLVCGMNKPNKQTILPLRHIKELYRNLSLKKVQGLGGKFGEKLCEELGIEKMGELTRFSKEELQRRYDERSGNWLYNIARGIDLDAVQPRMASKSIGCCKKFPGRNAITGMATLKHWFNELAKEICERLQQDELENNRRPKQMVVSYVQSIGGSDVSSSRSISFPAIDEEKIVSEAIDTLKKHTEKFFRTPDNVDVLNNPIKFLGLSVGKFENADSKATNTISEMFKKNAQAATETSSVDATFSTPNREHEEPKLEVEKPKEKKSFFETFWRKKNANEEPSTSTASVDETIVEPVEDEIDEKFEEAIDESNSTDVTTHSEPVASTSSAILPPSIQSNRVPDYRETYAEFYRPTPVEQPKQKCDQCNKMIVESELQIHADSHLAQRLIDEERAEFRRQMDSKAKSVSTPPAKKQKTSKSMARTNSSNSLSALDKFLVKRDETNANISNISIASATSTSTSGDTETDVCAECGKAIPIDEMPEHADFHVAKRLHQEMIESDRAALSQTMTATNNLSAKKRAKTSKNNSRNKTKSIPSIASFFQNS